MANNVNVNVEFRNLNEAGKAMLEEMYSRVRPYSKNHAYEWFSDIWVDGKEGSPTYDITDTYKWTTEHIGPKWSYFDEFDNDSTDGASFKLTCAWSYPEIGLEWIVKKLGEVNPKIIALVTYEDEMPNQYGCSIFTSGGIWEAMEWDYDELIENLHIIYPELLKLKNEDVDGDDSDEYNEFKYEVMYEYMFEKQWELLNEWVEYINEKGLR